MVNDWIKVFSTGNPIEAEIVLSMLHEHGIDAVEMNKRDSSYQVFGYVELYCPKDNVIEALHLINKK
jgi:type III secretory pathway lipoprotein EscJ